MHRVPGSKQCKLLKHFIYCKTLCMHTLSRILLLFLLLFSFAYIPNNVLLNYFKFNSVTYFVTDDSCGNVRNMFSKLKSVAFFFKMITCLLLSKAFFNKG